MARYLLTLTPAQAVVMREHCAHARFVWNLAVEQQSWWRRGRQGAQALRDFGPATRAFYASTHRKPGFRKASRSNGFRITGPAAQRVRRLNRHHGQVWVPRAGWVRFRNRRAKVKLAIGSGWGLLVGRLEDKAPGRVEKVDPRFTGQTCSACGTRDREARENQASFRCRSCGHAENADVNAAKNIARGHRVTARGGLPQSGRPLNREPQAA
jgi:predicted RNA-binding Zn-ribbon protein involved in translation (DUF1610 family)